jgi:type III secretion protein N (ATPase)
VLSRALAQAAHYPAIDVLASVSRVFTRVTAPEHQQAARRLRALMARHAEIRLLLQVGEYTAGSDALADEAIARHDRIQAFLQQSPDEASPWDETQARLQALVH